MRRVKVFADTFYWVALTSAEDHAHTRALAFSRSVPARIGHDRGSTDRILDVLCKRTAEPSHSGGQSQAGVIAAMRVDDSPVAVVQEEIACQLLLRGFAGEAGVPRRWSSVRKLTGMGLSYVLNPGFRSIDPPHPYMRRILTGGFRLDVATTPITNGGDFARRIGFAVPISGIQTTGVVRCDQPRFLAGQGVHTIRVRAGQ